MGIVVLFFTIVFFMSQVLPVRGKFKEICERPNGSCRHFCTETEIHVGRCLDGRLCCLPVISRPRIESTTTK
ncbi:putative beta-defensin 108A [Choloepus didactylus]|uniref:putative beta-defensin 108A n=1 Tax=Choloepus didactylus TaxID=27675 RepID=UPI00189FFFCD|nr:putative beta-defensin 108A [Choloepus didactylus]